MTGLHISLKAEDLFHFYGVTVTNSMLASILVTVFCIIVAILYKLSKSSSHYLVHGVVSSLYKFSESIVGPKKVDIFFPLFATFFIYILFSNWFGLIPGIGGVFYKNSSSEAHSEVSQVHLLRAPTADLNTTIALAIISVIAAQYYGFKYLGLKKQLGKYFDFSSPINFYIGILELISELSKILSFSFRLFGNVFAGEVLLIVIGFLIPLFASTPFILLELMVGLIQAFVFSMLSLVFMSMSIEHH